MSQAISIQHLKYLTALNKKKYRKINRQFLIEGIKLCEEALDSDFNFLELYYSPSILTSKYQLQNLKKYQQQGVQLFKIEEADLKKLSDTVHSQGIVGLLQTKIEVLNNIEFSSDALIVMVEQLTDPGNLGTIIRIADWFGAAAIIIDHLSTDWLNPKVIRASMGSVFHLPVISDVKLIEILPDLKKHNFQIIGATLDGNVLGSENLLVGRKAILFGNESRGLSKTALEHADFTVSIPGYGKAESLNVAVAAGIILYQLKRNPG